MRKTRPVLSALALAVLLPLATPSWSAVEIAVNFGPPPLPVYEQPPAPAEGYIWTPGYWAWDDDYGDYYWVPGTWVLAPQPGYLWTPGWWGWDAGYFRWHEGYWGLHVGFYGGINYGYGYPGEGYWGGRWEGRRFMYNTAVNNINTRYIHNVYHVKVVNNYYNTPRTSFNGGNGGVQARPTPVQQRWMREEPRLRPTEHQVEQIHIAERTPELRAGANHGAPPIAATQRPTEFHGNAIVRARNQPTVSGPPPRGERPQVGGGERDSPAANSPEIGRGGPGRNERPATYPRERQPQAPQVGGGERDSPAANSPSMVRPAPQPAPQAPSPRVITRPGQAQPAPANEPRGERPNRDWRDQQNQREPGNARDNRDNRDNREPRGQVTPPPQVQPQPRAEPAPRPEAPPRPEPRQQPQPQPQPRPPMPPQAQQPAQPPAASHGQQPPQGERRGPPEEHNRRNDKNDKNDR